MSWDYYKSEVRCETCGKTGFCVSGSDDWNRSSTDWIGFDSIAPSATAITRRQSDPGNTSPVCACGSKNIVVGKFLGSCDSAGKLTK